MVGVNQTAIPIIKTDNDALNQSQQNVNKVLRNLQNRLVDVQNMTREFTIIGEVKFASLTLSQFQATAGKGWILANGQSCVGTTYSALTLNNTVPNISLAGSTAFIRVNV